MTIPDFNPCDRSTWRDALTIDEVAQILRRSVGGILKACQRHTFQPRPFERRPPHWRKADVIRHLERTRETLRRVS